MNQDETNHDKTSWESMKLNYVGDVGDIIKMPGVGKTGTGGDPGDFLKQPGNG